MDQCSTNADHKFATPGPTEQIQLRLMFARRSSGPALRHLFWILLMASVAVAPMLVRGYQFGHDLEIHLNSWLEASSQFREGIIFPRWASQANYGFGEPRFIFYPPGSWVLGGLLGLLLPWKAVPAVFIWITIIVSAACMRRFAADWLPPNAALLAALLYAANPYLIANAYTRSAYGELLASAVFPLILWGAFRVSRDPLNDVPIVAIALAVIWLANLPAAVITMYAFGLILIVTSVSMHSIRPLLYGAAATLIAFALAAFALLPAAWEQRWVYIEGVLHRNQLPWANFLFSPHDVAVMPNFNRLLSPLAVAIILGALAAAIGSRRMRFRSPATWWALTALCVIAAFLMFPPSKPVWRSLPELRFVQFPWRWLFPMCAGAALLAPFAFQERKRRRLYAAVLGFAVLAVDAAIVCAKPLQPNLVPEIVERFHSPYGYAGLIEYTPLAAKDRQFRPDAPFVEPLPTDVASAPQIHVDLWSPERKVITANLPHPAAINVKLLAYPGWKANINGKSVAVQHEPRTGQVVLVLPTGSSRTELKFTDTWDRVAGEGISIATVFGLLAFWWLIAAERRRATKARAPDAVPVTTA